MKQKARKSQDIVKILVPIFMAFPIKKAILFGSYAKGTQTENSDIDLVIDSNGKIRGIDFFEVLDVLQNNLKERSI